MSGRLVVVLGIGLALAGCGGVHRAGGTGIAAADPPSPTDGINRSITMAAAESARRPTDYRLGPEDLVDVTLYDIVGRTGEPRHVTARVSRSGVVTLPLVGSVAIAGKTATEAEETLRTAYRRFIHEPQVAVFVKEYRSYRVSVVGYVEKPGVYEVAGERTLLEVIAMAGGLNPAAGKTIHVSRATRDRMETMIVDLDRLAREGDVRLNLAMLPGDVVNVPKAGVVYVEGSVKKPGAYRLRESMTLTQAISMAGGPDDKIADRGGTRLFRSGASGERVEVPIDIGAIDSGRAEDVVLTENDVVVVPMSTTKYVIDRFIGGIGMGLSVPVF